MNNKKTIFAIIIAIIILIAVISGILIFKNSNNKEEEKKGEIVNQEQLSEEELVYNAKYEINVEQTSYKDNFGREYSVEDIKLPYINLDSEDAKKANKEIEELHKNLIKEFKENIGYAQQKMMTNDFVTSYNTYINGDILSILIEEDRGYDGKLHNSYYTYNFDVKTGKMLSYEEVYKKAGFTEENISEKVENAIKTLDVYNETEQSEADKCIQKTIKAYNDRSLKNIGFDGIDAEYYLGYFLNEGGKLNIVIYIDIFADVGYKLDVITVL